MKKTVKKTVRKKTMAYPKDPWSHLSKSQERLRKSIFDGLIRQGFGTGRAIPKNKSIVANNELLKKHFLAKGIR